MRLRTTNSKPRTRTANPACALPASLANLGVEGGPPSKPPLATFNTTSRHRRSGRPLGNRPAMMSIPGRADKCEMERERDFPSVEARARKLLCWIALAIVLVTTLYTWGWWILVNGHMTNLPLLANFRCVRGVSKIDLSSTRRHPSLRSRFMASRCFHKLMGGAPRFR